MTKKAKLIFWSLIQFTKCPKTINAMSTYIEPTDLKEVSSADVRDLRRKPENKSQSALIQLIKDSLKKMLITKSKLFFW